MLRTGSLISSKVRITIYCMWDCKVYLIRKKNRGCPELEKMAKKALLND
jgi:hypothetical protein